MTKMIVFNGKAYTDPSEMPADVRTLYDRAMAMLVDSDRNGIPDALERGGLGDVISIQETRLIVNGKEYGSAAELPPEVRRIYDMAVAQAGGLGASQREPRLLAIKPGPAPQVALEGFNWGGVIKFAFLAGLAAALVFWLL